MTSEIRQGETFARVGGEEFAVLLPHTGLTGATTFAHRLLKKVRESPALLRDRPGESDAVVHFTASIGVAAIPAESGNLTSIDALLGQADRALYRSKAGGRDRVEVSEELA